jgi:16S rRNA (guanine527-N7)-methyltransferase
MAGEDAAPDWSRLTQGAESFGVTLDETQVASLQLYMRRLREWNARFNLTAIQDPDEILTKHFLDSLSCALVVDFQDARSLVDVGTGAGFPGLVLKIAYPHLDVVLLDAVQKRLNFLQHVAEELGLKQLRTVHARAEDAATAAPRPGTPTAPRLREQFDVVTARAVSRLAVLAEWTVPFARAGGAVLAMKGPEPTEEVQEAERALKLLGAGPPVVRELQLPGTDLGRSLIRIPKVRPTPRTYPRPPGTARKAPL